MLRQRQQTILGATIREYIRTARPVSSEELRRHFRLGLSPATIRNEMQELDEEGFLEQPHTSAGRIPTDNGYRFFVDHLIREFILSGEDQKIIDDLRKTNNEDLFIKHLARTVSRMCGAFAATGLLEDGILYKSGFAEILDEPEFEDAGEARTFGHFVDFLDDTIEDILPDSEEDHVFIGRENPLKEARAYTMIMSSWKHPAGFNGFLTLIGPRRMDYTKSVSLINYLKELKEE